MIKNVPQTQTAYVNVINVPIKIEEYRYIHRWMCVVDCGRNFSNNK